MMILLSGGLDSTVLAAHALTISADPVETLSVHYGQRHAREITAAAAVASHYGIAHDVADLSALRGLLAGSALTGGAPVPEGHYSAPSMAVTVVPNRNMIMLAVAVGAAAGRGHRQVAYAVHAGDHPIYPDCRPEFVAAANLASLLGTAGYGDVEIAAPFVHMSKADIAALGARLGAPMHLSWSCYQGGEQHCGRCGTCVERAEAFTLAGVPDPTRYADPGYWRTAAARP
jgi:7-cyano-7-deazaguanine synthase